VLLTNFAVLGFANQDYTDESYRAFARDGIEKFSRRAIDPEHWSDYEKAIFFLKGSFDDAATFQRLKQRLDEIEPKFAIPGTRVYYLAIPPSLIDMAVTQLQAAGLVAPPGQSDRFSRIIVEKPIGHDLESARQINAKLANVFDETQI